MPRTEIPPVALVALMRQDGVEIPPGAGERPIKCPLPHHDDGTASASVNVGTGLWYCHACSVGGSAWTYLAAVRQMADPDIRELLQRDHGWTPAQLDSGQHRDEARAAKDDRRPKIAQHIQPEVRKDGAIGPLIAEHRYSDASGKLLWVVGRYDTAQNKSMPKTLPFTVRAEGGFWLCGPKNQLLPDGDRIDGPSPLYRLPDLLKAMDAMPDAQIWVVEGEKCVDRLLDTGAVAKPVTCGYGGTPKSLETVDWSPIYNRRVVLVADSDRVGRNYMVRLGKHLADNGCECRYVLPPGDDGFDVADVIVRDGPDGVLQWCKSVGVKDHAGVHPKKEPKEAAPPLPPMTETEHFRVLGRRDGKVVIQSRRTWEVYEFSASQLHQPGSLIELAPLGAWLAILQGDWSVATRERVCDAIVRASQQLGEITDRLTVYRLGAAQLSSGAVVFNTGKHLLTGQDRLVGTASLGGHEDAIFTPGPEIPMDDDENAKRWGQELYDAVIRYRWQLPGHGRVFLGWIVASIVGGALPFRPMVWLTAPAAAGKTYLLSEVLGRVLGPLLEQISDVTAAGLAAAAGRDSLPLYIDEFEPPQGPREIERFQEVIKIIRSSTSGAGGRVRGTQAGGRVSTNPRFSAICASVQWPRMSAPAASRFVHIRLARAGVPDWPDIQRAIRAATGRERCAAIRTEIIRSAPLIVAKARDLETRYITAGIDTRRAQITAALTAGAGFLSGDYAAVSGDERPVQDLYDPLDRILSHVIRLPAGHEMTLVEIIRAAWFDTHGQFNGQVVHGEYMQIASRYGFRVVGQNEIWVAPRTPLLVGVLERGGWAGIAVDDYFLSLPGATRPRTASGAYCRMKVGDRMRGVVVLGEQVMAEIGFQPGQSEDG